MPKKGYKQSKATKEKMGKTIKKKGIYKHQPQQGFQKGHKINFKGGKWKHGEGYIYILMHEHPHCNKNGYIGESRLIVESQIGRYLKPQEKCHHIGIKYPISSKENKHDNRPENLMAFINHSVHLRFHFNSANVKPEEIIFDGRKLKQPTL